MDKKEEKRTEASDEKKYSRRAQKYDLMVTR
jgi:hypothetical protein